MPEPIQGLVDELRAARDEFFVALGDIEPGLLLAPGLVGEWSALELVAHLAYWNGHATEAIHHAEQDRLDAFMTDDVSVDDRNAVVARVAREADYATAQKREAATFDAFVKRLRTVEPDWLSEIDADGDTLQEIVLYDGADHYREHTADIRAWFSGAPEDDD